MVWVFLAGLGLAPILARTGPAPTLARDRLALRAMECERLDLEAARRREPGRIRPERERGDFIRRDALHCSTRLLPEGSRLPAAEAVLTRLHEHSQDWAARALRAEPRPAARYLVQANLDDPTLAEKVRVAALHALAEAGAPVADRRPLLQVDQLEAVAALGPDEGWPRLCALWSGNGELPPETALVVLHRRDPRETGLHLGLCREGAFRWLP